MKYPKKYPKEEGWRFAKYSGIPCYFHLWDNILVGRNWFYNLLLDFQLFYDVEIRFTQTFKIELIEDESKNKDIYKG